MTLPPLPVLIYANPSHSPCPRYMHVYLAEKRIPSTHVVLVPPAHMLESAEYPPAPAGPSPVVAIRKSQDLSPTASKSYTFLYQSIAILEYLEDICDSDPSITPVGSLRGGDDGTQRLRIRAVLSHVDELFAFMGTSVMLGNKTLAKVLQAEHGLNAASSRAVKSLADREFARLDALLLETTDFAGLKEDRAGAANLGDILVYVLLSSYTYGYGFDLEQTYPGIKKVLDGFSARSAAQAGLLTSDSKQKYDTVEPFREGWIEKIW